MWSENDMQTLISVYLVIMVIWCCVGFVVGYVIEEELTTTAFLGLWTGVIWPLSLIGFLLIGIGRIILWIRDTIW